MANEFCPKMPDFHVTFRDLLHAVNIRHGTNGFPSLPKESVLRIFSALKKNPTASAGFEPPNLGTKGQHATSRPPTALKSGFTSTSVSLEAITYPSFTWPFDTDLQCLCTRLYLVRIIRISRKAGCRFIKVIVSTVFGVVIPWLWRYCPNVNQSWDCVWFDVF